VTIQDQDAVAAEGLVSEVLVRSGLTPLELARYLGASLVSVVRWQRGDTKPDAQTRARLTDLCDRLESGLPIDRKDDAAASVFASRGARRSIDSLPLFRSPKKVEVSSNPGAPLVSRFRNGPYWAGDASELARILEERSVPAPTTDFPIGEGVSAGKNTYTYDAHTYHTKVPPQGIATVIDHYLPQRGLVLDPFAGSGMTGVAARALGADVILNELSPAASFISSRFTQASDPSSFACAVKAVCDSLSGLRRALYATQCRACGKETELLHTVWSYRVICYNCSHEFLLWDHCRQYGKTVREHEILSEFKCPSCTTVLKKSRLSRTKAEPVLVGYKCCSKAQVEHPPSDADLKKIRSIEAEPPLADGFFPSAPLPDGVNLCQPKRHGLTTIDRFYTSRNLAAMSHIWREIHRLVDDHLAASLAFVFTSLYQRVTRLSEFRFWGGSGNTARFNVPYIFNEANVFVTFERKARTIQDHLETTAKSYSGRCVIRTGSATDLSFIPDGSIDMIFTDPPFGGNINYSEMNFLWEAWLGDFTDSTHEAIVNKFQNKDVARYGMLMSDSLKECYRVLRPGHWMILVFMNSSEGVWRALRDAVAGAGFSIGRVDIFDKQHGTFKQFVSENTAGCDLMLHCQKPSDGSPVSVSSANSGMVADSVSQFLAVRKGPLPTLPYLHVQRQADVDYRMLYSEFLAARFMDNGQFVDFSSFRTHVDAHLKSAAR
jgi:DNA modification methylase